MSLAQIRADARMAVQHVRQTMPRGAANIAQMQNQEDEADVVNRVDAMRHVLGQVATMLKDENQIDAKMDILQSVLGEKMEAGNCHEQASAAYLFLTNKGINGVQLLKIEMKVLCGEDSHVFVGITLDGSSLSGKQGYALGEESNVCICDPWLAELAKKEKIPAEYTTGVYSPEQWEEAIDGLQVAQTKKRVESL